MLEFKPVVPQRLKLVSSQGAAGAKARVLLLSTFAARLKSCPVTELADQNRVAKGHP